MNESDAPSTTNVLAYVAQLEMEVDRLRRHDRLLHETAASGLRQLKEILVQEGTAHQPACDHLDRLLDSLRVIHEMPRFFAAEDQVIAVAVRPLVEQLFRGHKRLLGAEAELHLVLEVDYVEWFPGRLRYILDNLISNGLRYRDAGKRENWVRVELRRHAAGYEFDISDNGLGMSATQRERAFDVGTRAGPVRTTSPAVGLSVVKHLVEQSGGALEATSGDGQGSTLRLFLPRYALDDFIL